MNESPRNVLSLQRFMAMLLAVSLLTGAGCDKVQEMVDNASGDPDVTENPENPAANGPTESTDPVAPENTDPTPPVNPDPVKPVEPEPPKVDPQEVINKFLNTEPRARGNAMLEELASLESGLEQITEVDLNRSTVTDAGLVHLAKFPALKTLDLTHCKITPQGLAPVASHPTIESLNLAETLVRDAGIDQIVGIAQLRELDLTNCRVTDPAVVKLASLTNLEKLILNNNQSVQGVGFDQVTKNCENLKILGVNRTGFCPDGFLALKGTGIEELHASSCQGTNAGVYELRFCKKLTKLDISYNSDVSDIGVSKLVNALSKQLIELSLAGTGGGSGLDKNTFNQLARCKNLTQLDLSSTSPPKGWVEQLRGMLKETEINWDGK